MMLKAKTVFKDSEGGWREGRDVKLNMDRAWYAMEQDKGVLFIAFGDSEDGSPRGLLVKGNLGDLR